MWLDPEQPSTKIESTLRLWRKSMNSLLQIVGNWINYYCTLTAVSDCSFELCIGREKRFSHKFTSDFSA